MHMDVALFRRFMEEAGANYPGGPGLLAAKIVGRWPDGTPLSLSPDRPDPAVAGNPERVNDFRYADDPDGVRCPLGAHVRRTNPRDNDGMFGGKLSNRHRIMRRGRPYGPLLPAGRRPRTTGWSGASSSGVSRPASPASSRPSRACGWTTAMACTPATTRTS